MASASSAGRTPSTRYISPERIKCQLPFPVVKKITFQMQLNRNPRHWNTWNRNTLQVINMKISQLFGQTLRDIPAEADVVSHQLLMRAGFIRPLGAGIFSYLHLAKRSMQKIEAILRDEMDRIGGQEISMPVVHPAELWKETGRWYQIGSEMGRFKDRNDHDMVLAMTHEEVVADLVRQRSSVLQAVAAPGLPPPDQVARRPAPARRVDPRPRVHHEGQLQPGCRLGWSGQTIPRPLPGLFQHLPPLRPGCDRSQIRSPA